jgi:hypothetical protein
MPIAGSYRSLAALLTGALMPVLAAEAQSVRRAVTRIDGTTLSPAEVEGAVERLMRAGRVPGLATRHPEPR